jgi:uncharacterized protein
MKPRLALLAALVWAALAPRVPADDSAGVPPFRDQARPAIDFKVAPFDPEDVRLLDGPFKHAMELDQDYLLSLDVDRLLRNFRVNAGIPTSAKPLGGWEDPKCELRGHFVGHYLSACALMYASLGDPRLKAKGDAVVAGLAECQAKLSGGYLSAFPESYIDRVEKRQPVWAPYYTLHKILAGLLDMYVDCHNRQALAVAKRFGDWMVARNSRLTDAQMQAMLNTEQGGINEALANLYGLTGDKKYLALSLRFDHRAVLVPASQGVDNLTGLHANTQIPKFIGAARQYELTGTPRLGRAASFFWHTVVSNRTYVIGGNSDGEHFTDPSHFSRALGPNTTETCNTYNMLKLTRHLFCWDPRPEYADYYERALYNDILASQNPATGMMCYYVPLRSGSRKYYNTPLDSFWCCTGTGVENHAKYGNSIYFHAGRQALYVNLFIASELNWQSLGLKLRQETRFPDEPRTRLTFSCERPLDLAVHLRRPAWATAGFAVRLNGRALAVDSRPGSYVVLRRTWRHGDTVEVSMPFTLHTEGFRDNPRRFAFLNGPLVLCAQIDMNRETRRAHPPDDFAVIGLPGQPGQSIPAVVTAPGRRLAALRPVRGKPSTFTGSSRVFRVLSGGQGKTLTFAPFYKMYGDRHYVVYWDAYTPDQWRGREAEYRAAKARERALNARTVDAVQPGNQGSERAHDFRGERTGAGELDGHHWRHALDGGWFSYQVKVLPGEPQELCMTYWGSDSGGRVFDVLVNGRKLTTITLDNNRPGVFYNATCPLPADLIRGRAHVTVRLQAHPGRTAGGLFGLRVLRGKAAPNRH